MDRVQRMLENQRKREEQMKAKSEAAAANEAAQREAAQAEALSKMNVSASTAASRGDGPVEFGNNIKMRRNFYAPLPSVTRGKPTLIGGDPNGENILYCNGNDVIIRSLRDPLQGDMYVEHSRATTVARYSPDGRFIASADQTGTVRVWHTEIVQDTKFKLKLEKRVIGGAILDLAWDAESKRIVAVGLGKEKMGEAFDMETGSSRGEITGHSKAITSCDVRPTKPYRVATASEDFGCAWHEGPPFKWKSGISDHTRFVNCVRFSPDGNSFITVSSDKQGFIYDGLTAEKKGKLNSQGGHTGGIYCCSWSPDGTQVLTASGDKTCKIWDVSTGNCVTTFTFGNAVEDQQLGCIWQGNYLVSLSLAGHFNYLDPSSPNKPVKVVTGHSKSIESVAYHRASNSIYSGSYDSVVVRWDESSGEMAQVGGDGHKNSVVGMEFQGDNLFTVSMDDTLRVTPHGSDFTGTSVTLGGKPYGLAVAPRTAGLALSGTFEKQVLLVKDGRIVHTKQVSYTPQSFAFSQDESEVAVGGDDKKIHVYALNGEQLGNETVLEGHRETITKITYSPDGKYMASGDKNRTIILWENHQLKINNWVYHTAAIGDIAWSPDSKHLASGSLDTNIIIWSVDEPTKRVTIEAAHHGGINGVEWIDNQTVITVGQDSSLRTWNISWE